MKETEQLVERIQSATTPDDVRRILWSWEGREDVALELICKYSPVFDENLVHILLASGAHLGALRHNPNWPTEYNETVLKWLIKRIKSEPEPRLVQEARDSLQQLFKGGWASWGDPIVASLAEMAMEEEQWYDEEGMAATLALLGVPDVPSDVIEVLSEGRIEWLDSPDDFLAFISHPNATSSLRQEIAEQYLAMCSAEQIENFIFAKQVRRIPELRPILLEHARKAFSDQAFNESASALLFMSDANPSDCAKIFREAREDVAARALRWYGKDIAPLLSREDLTRLLSSKDREVRLTAIAHLSMVPGGDLEHHEAKQASESPRPI